MNFYQRMGILPLKKRVNRDKCSFATAYVWGLCYWWDPSLSRNPVPALYATLPHSKVSNNHLPMDYSRVQVWILAIEALFFKLGFHWDFLFSLKLSQAGRGQLMQDFVHYTQSYPSNSKRPGCFKTILIPSKSAPITSFLLLGQWLVCFSLSNRCWIWHLLCQVTSYVQWGSCWRNPLRGKNNCQKKLKLCLFSDMTLPSGLMWDWLGDVPLAELGPGPSLG